MHYVKIKHRNELNHWNVLIICSCLNIQYIHCCLNNINMVNFLLGEYYRLTVKRFINAHTFIASQWVQLLESVPPECAPVCRPPLLMFASVKVAVTLKRWCSVNEL